jgi:hypothetical protein
MNTNIVTQLKKYISINNITFLNNFDKSIDININGKSMFIKMSEITPENIENFILSLDFKHIYVVNPFISIKCKYDDPIIGLSRGFLISNCSNSELIYKYIHNQYKKAINDFQMEKEIKCFVMLNYKKVTFTKINPLRGFNYRWIYIYFSSPEV